MRKFWTISAAALILASCGGNTTKQGGADTAESVKLTREQMLEMNFNELFTPIEPTEMPGNVFDLVGEDFTVITAGRTGVHNSMVASWGGWGILFNKPATWCFLRANRYTLEFMRKEMTYTMCYFDDEYKEDIMLFGTKSGRSSDKMNQSRLLPVTTPGGSTAYKEAKLVIECGLTQITTVSPDDFYLEEPKSFVEEGFIEADDWHKLVFGEITGLWVKK